MFRVGQFIGWWRITSVELHLAFLAGIRLQTFKVPAGFTDQNEGGGFGKVDERSGIGGLRTRLRSPAAVVEHEDSDERQDQGDAEPDRKAARVMPNSARPGAGQTGDFTVLLEDGVDQRGLGYGEELAGGLIDGHRVGGSKRVCGLATFHSSSFGSSVSRAVVPVRWPSSTRRSRRRARCRRLRAATGEMPRTRAASPGPRPPPGFTRTNS